MAKQRDYVGKGDHTMANFMGSVGADGTFFVDCIRPLGKVVYRHPQLALVAVVAAAVIGLAYGGYRLFLALSNSCKPSDPHQTGEPTTG
jgi:hypothetical protein